MRNFESDVQLIKYKVLKEVARLAYNGTLEQEYKSIPETVIPGPKPITRCCIYKERAIVGERVKVAMGGDKNNSNVVEVISIACDQCPINRFTVTEACRGCLAHKCKEVCPANAIYYVGQRAYIDTNRCKECGRCKTVCPYNAISDVMRPCKKACNANALSFDEERRAVIDNEKCIQCGACVYQCPFGAIMDKSFIVDVINLIKQAEKDDSVHPYAVIAPSISSQFTFTTIGKVVSGIKKLGFYDVVEVALGADMTAMHEAQEFAKSVGEKGFITSSCCPAFVSYIMKNYPEFKQNISTTVSPMISISRLIKKMDDKAKVVFIGPCTAKKAEIHQEGLEDACDIVMTFEELQAMLDALNIEIEKCEEAPLDNASFYGRIFARSGGLVESVKHVVDSLGLNIEFKPVACDGLKECEKNLKLAKFKKLGGNFIEGMACPGGCIGGAASLTHGPKDKSEVDKYGKMAKEKSVSDALRVLDLDDIVMERKF